MANALEQSSPPGKTVVGAQSNWIAASSTWTIRRNMACFLWLNVVWILMKKMCPTCSKIVLDIEPKNSELRTWSNLTKPNNFEPFWTWCFPPNLIEPHKKSLSLENSLAKKWDEHENLSQNLENWTSKHSISEPYILFLTRTSNSPCKKPNFQTGFDPTLFSNVYTSWGLKYMGVIQENRVRTKY